MIENTLFHVSLAKTEKQIGEIAHLASVYGIHSRPPAILSQGSQVIAVTDPRTRTVIQAMRLGLAFNQAQVNGGTITWDGGYPVMLIEESWGPDDRLLRYISIQLAALMDIPVEVQGKSIGTMPICAQLGELTGSTEEGRAKMLSVPPVLRPKYVGKSIASHPRPVDALMKGDFMDALEELQVNLPRHMWLEDLAFEEFFDPSLVEKVKTALTDFAPRPY